YDVGRRGLDAAIRAFEKRGPATALLGRALSYFGISDAFDLIPAVYERFDKSRIAGFAREVSVAREEGDPVAASILSHAAADLAALVVSVASRLQIRVANGKIALSGGFVEGESFLKGRLGELLSEALPSWTLVPAAGDAAQGACAIARELGRTRAGKA
ncbi:MAG TPA: BadF/BadG/BcrA/BcrD ATPase family protein, partial [Rectinemataceae bacterium]